MEIQGAGGVSGPEPVKPNRIHSSPFNSPPAKNKSSDKVEISDLARYKTLLDKVPDLRLERIEEIRAQIEAGTYESEEKIKEVVERLMEEFL